MFRRRGDSRAKVSLKHNRTHNKLRENILGMRSGLKTETPRVVPRLTYNRNKDTIAFKENRDGEHLCKEATNTRGRKHRS